MKVVELRAVEVVREEVMWMIPATRPRRNPNQRASPLLHASSRKT